MAGNGRDPSDPIDFVLVPYGVDEGEMDIDPIGEVSIRLTDLDDGLTVIGVPEDLDDASIHAVADAIESSVQERGIHRQFIIVKGLQSKWRFFKLIRKDQWDAQMQEPRARR